MNSEKSLIYRYKLKFVPNDIVTVGLSSRASPRIVMVKDYYSYKTPSRMGEFIFSVLRFVAIHFMIYICYFAWDAGVLGIGLASLLFFPLTLAEYYFNVPGILWMSTRLAHKN
jgi:hypothetical protein